jgi:hypothetical protein
MKKSTIVLFLLSGFFFCSLNCGFAQDPMPTVKIYLKNYSLLPKGVGLKMIKPNQEVDISYRGSWMPLAKKAFEVAVGTRIEFIADKSAIMSGKADQYQGKLIVTVKADDAGKTFSF